MKNVIKIALLLLVSFAAVMCKKKVQPTLSEINKDCGCAKEVSAKFLQEELGSLPGASFEAKNRTNTDTTFGNKNVRFYAEESNAEYTWLIGTEVIHTRSFYRYFGNNLAGQTLPITLIVKKKPNNICLPNDNGMDTVIRYLTVVHDSVKDQIYNTPNHFEGTYRMKDVNMADSVDIIINFVGVPDLSPDLVLINNYDGLGSNTQITLDNINYQQFIRQGSVYSYISFLINVNGTKELTLEGSGGLHPERHYKGRKIL
jgi:hypothetical protein